jgi:hypothetical protein
VRDGIISGGALQVQQLRCGGYLLLSLYISASQEVPPLLDIRPESRLPRHCLSNQGGGIAVGNSPSPYRSSRISIPLRIPFEVESLLSGRERSSAARQERHFKWAENGLLTKYNRKGLPVTPLNRSQQTSEWAFTPVFPPGISRPSRCRSVPSGNTPLTKAPLFVLGMTSTILAVETAFH